MSYIGNTPKCLVCQKSAHPFESVHAEEKGWYHNLCLKCVVCNSQLTLSTCENLAGFIYCRAHYGQLLKEIKEEQAAQEMNGKEGKDIFPHNKPGLQKSRSGSLIMLEGRNALPQLRKQFQPNPSNNTTNTDPSPPASPKGDAPSSPGGSRLRTRAGDAREKDLNVRIAALEADLAKSRENEKLATQEAQKQVEDAKDKLRKVMEEEKQLVEMEKGVLEEEKQRLIERLKSAEAKSTSSKHDLSASLQAERKKVAEDKEAWEKEKAEFLAQLQRDKKAMQKEKADVAKLLKETQKSPKAEEGQKKEEALEEVKKMKADLEAREEELKRETAKFESEMEKNWLQVDEEKRKVSAESREVQSLRAEVEADRAQLVKEREEWDKEKESVKSLLEEQRKKHAEDQQTILRKKGKSKSQRQALKADARRLEEEQKKLEEERSQFEEQVEVQLNVIEDQKQEIEKQQDKIQRKRRKAKKKKQAKAKAVKKSAREDDSLDSKDKIAPLLKDVKGGNRNSLDRMEDELEALLQEVRQEEAEHDEETTDSSANSSDDERHGEDDTPQGDGGVSWLCNRLPGDQGDRLRTLKQRLTEEKQRHIEAAQRQQNEQNDAPSMPARDDGDYIDSSDGTVDLAHAN